MTRPPTVRVHRPCFAEAEYPATIDEVIDLAGSAFEAGSVPEKFAQTMLRTEVRTRRYIRPAKQIFTDGHAPSDWAETVDLLAHLAQRAAAAALDQAGLSPRQIDALVVTSVTGYAMPGVDAALIKALRLDPAVRRIPVAQIGCAGGLFGLIRAREQIAAYPGSRVLVVASEAFSTVLQPGNRRLDAMIYKALGGDGAAATVVTDRRATPPDVAHLMLEDTFEYLVPDTETCYRLTTDPAGHLGFASTSAAPGAISMAEAPLRRWLDSTRPGRARTPRPVGFMIAHHGGPAVLENTARAFGLESHALRHSWASLREAGNMGSVSILDVMARTLDDVAEDAARGVGTAVSIGPGVSICAARLTRP